MNLSVMEDFSEIINYENLNLPLYISRGQLSNFSNMKALGHWHDDFEIVLALQGKVSYDVNGKKFLLRAGDALVINSQQMHYPYSADGTDGEYLCVLFQPQILTGNKFIVEKYILPILQPPYITEKFFQRSKDENHAVLAAIDKFLEIPQVAGYEFEFLSCALNFWSQWFKFLNREPLISYQNINSGIEIQKRMVNFIYQNYQKKISLDEIAKAGNVCKSVCCKMFKEYLGKTPIDFLNSYRIQIATKFINDSKLSITEIAFNCGFSSPSYFAAIFFKLKGCTPKEYRNLQKNFSA